LLDYEISTKFLAIKKHYTWNTHFGELIRVAVKRTRLSPIRLYCWQLGGLSL